MLLPPPNNEYIIGSGRARVLAIVVGALVEGAIAYGFYYLSQWVGDASPWWYVARFFMVNTLFSLWMIVFACVCDVDTSEGKRVRKALR